MCNKPWCTCEDSEYYILRLEELETDLLQARAERDKANKSLLSYKTHAGVLRDALNGVMRFASHCEKHDLNGFSDGDGPEELARARAALAAKPEASR